jgi:hypothetical protein
VDLLLKEILWSALNCKLGIVHVEEKSFLSWHSDGRPEYFQVLSNDNITEAFAKMLESIWSVGDWPSRGSSKIDICPIRNLRMHL